MHSEDYGVQQIPDRQDTLDPLNESRSNSKLEQGNDGFSISQYQGNWNVERSPFELEAPEANS